MYVIHKILLFFVLCNLAFTECTCPNVKSADNFKLKILRQTGKRIGIFAAGTWHDFAISSNALFTGDIFASLTYEYKEENRITFKTEGIPETDPNFVGGFGKFMSNGKILYTYLAGEPKQWTDIMVTIMAVDSDFASLFGCKADDNKSQDIVWVTSRTKHPQGNVKAKIQNYLESYVSPITSEKVTWAKTF